MSTLDPRLRQSLFIAGTDTGVGKTWIATRLLRALVDTGARAAGMKPVAAGAITTAAGLRNDDALMLAAAGNVEIPYTTLNPYCLRQATSPDIAAAAEGVSIDRVAITREFARIASASRFVVVEGAGGWLAPIGDAETMADIAGDLQLPVLLVVGMRLGCISHALLTADAIRARQLAVAGWIANPVEPGFMPGSADFATYVDALERRLPAPRLQLL
jgi:dethiobiotin synthetase